MRNLAQALNGDIPIHKSDVKDMFEFEKELAKVNFLYYLNIAYLFFLQHHWTPIQINARSNETIYTTLGDLKRKIDTTVNVILPLSFSSCLNLVQLC
jgi:hypothetical protein